MLDPEHWTNTRDQRDQKAFNGTTFMFLGEWNSRPTEYTNNKESDSVWVTTYYPSNPKYGTAWQGVGNANEHILGQHILLINSQTENPDVCIQMADLEYSPEVTEILTWGIEGESFQEVDGKKTYLTAILESENPWLTANDYGIRISANQRSGLQLALDGAAWNEMATDSMVYIDGEAKWMNWGTMHTDFQWPDDPRIPPWNFAPPVQFTPDEQETMSNIMTPVKTYVEEMKFKFIKGDVSFDEWDTYLETLKTMGDYESVVKMYNDKVN